MNQEENVERKLPLAFHAFGIQEPHLLILHGLFGSSRNWRGFAQALEKEFRIWTIDLRNHGESPHAFQMSYQLMSEDVLEFAKMRELWKFGVLGHSMGGKTAMQMALDAPQQVRFLVVADIAPVGYTHQDRHGELIATMKQMNLNGIRQMSDADAALKIKVPDPVLRKFLLLNLKPDQNGMTWRLGLKGIDASLNRLLQALGETEKIYEGPALFVGGENSNYLHPRHHPEVRRFFPNSRIVMLKRAGHWLHAEQPDAFRKTVRSFLNAVCKQEEPS